MKALLYLTIVVLAAGLGTTTAHAIGSAVPAGWGHWASPGPGGAKDYQFVLDRQNVEWQTNWATTNNHSTADYNSGGEWYDIEGLYLDMYQESGQTYLSWLLVTGYSGLEVNEWTDFANWDLQKGAAQSVNHSTTYANIRDHADPYPQGGGTPTNPNPTQWAYRSNPVISMDLGGTNQWALILDTSENVNDPNQWGGRPDDFTTTAGLYDVTDTTKWVGWIAPPYNEYGATVPASDIDIKTNGTGAATAAATTTTSQKSLATDRSGLTDVQWGSDQAFDTAKILDGWPNPDMYYNWYWSGTMNVTGVSGFVPGGPGTAVHYALWCGNDAVNATWTPGLDEEHSLETTPELSSSALLLFGALPIGLGWWRRRKRA